MPNHAMTHSFSTAKLLGCVCFSLILLYCCDTKTHQILSSFLFVSKAHILLTSYLIFRVSIKIHWSY